MSSIYFRMSFILRFVKSITLWTKHFCHALEMDCAFTIWNDWLSFAEYSRTETYFAFAYLFFHLLKTRISKQISLMNQCIKLLCFSIKAVILANIYNLISQLLKVIKHHFQLLSVKFITYVIIRYFQNHLVSPNPSSVSLHPCLVMVIFISIIIRTYFHYI